MSALLAAKKKEKKPNVGTSKSAIVQPKKGESRNIRTTAKKAAGLTKSSLVPAQSKVGKIFQKKKKKAKRNVGTKTSQINPGLRSAHQSTQYSVWRGQPAKSCAGTKAREGLCKQPLSGKNEWQKEDNTKKKTFAR